MSGFKKPNPPNKVTGQACLEWIDKVIAFANHDPQRSYSDYANNADFQYYTRMFGIGDDGKVYNRPSNTIFTKVERWKHDTTKRKIGYVKQKSDDGGLEVAILGNDTIDTHSAEQGGNLDFYYCTMDGYSTAHYSGDVLSLEMHLDGLPNVYPLVLTDMTTHYDGKSYVYGHFYDNFVPISYDDFQNLDPRDHFIEISGGDWLGWTWGGSKSSWYTIPLDTDPNSLVFGVCGSMASLSGDADGVPYADILWNDPLALFSGNVYNYFADFNILCVIPAYPGVFLTREDMNLYRLPVGCTAIDKTNFTSIPYNLILTKDLTEAQNYIATGQIPHDAFLYPLDWDNLPGYEGVPEEPGEDHNTSDDDTRDITPNPPSAPTYTPATLSNYNWYWLQAGELDAFINWFWNDIGDWNDWNDIVETIKGLYNDLGSSILMIRYMPVDVSWIGGTGNNSPIIVGMIEQKGSSVATISPTTVAPIQEIGHIKIEDKYQSFVDMAPYSQLSLYLPFHGFVDLDINIFSGHSIYVKGVYDHLTGTLQYFLYCDNTWLVNSFTVKMAVDIPMSLQTKNDRDSAIFSNVMNSVSGMMGAGLTLGTGNPIGLVAGANAFNSGVNSAPMNVRGTVGESGAFYAPPQCAIILRRPTISKPDQNTWEKNVGQMCGKGHQLSRLSGLTICYQPRINFSNSIPLQSEIEEIYQILTEGVIL